MPVEGVIWVAVKTGCPASWEKKGAWLAGTMVVWRDWELVALHHLVVNIEVYVPLWRAMPVQR